MANSDIPSWKEWDEELTKEQREYSLYKILHSLDARMTTLESTKYKTGLLTLGGSFLGGASTMGMAMLAKLVFWK